jgi:hypothetical protein
MRSSQMQVSMRIIAIHRSVRRVSAFCFSRDRRGAGLARLSAKAARALNRAALETNCRTFRFHSSTSQRTKSPLCSEPRARPAFQLSWQSPSPITFCVFSNTSSFTAAISDYIRLQAIALMRLQAIALKRPVNRYWPRQWRCLRQSPLRVVESALKASRIHNGKLPKETKEKLPHGYEHKDH